jgi:hypothetical protein
VSTLAEAREAVATALSTVVGVDVRARPWRSAGKPGDGWVNVTRVVPAGFVGAYATLSAVVILSADDVDAEASLDVLATTLMNAVTGSDLNPADVVLEPATVPVGQSATPLYVLVLTLTLEVT